MNALITGAGGFVGTHLTSHLLACGDRVIAMAPEIDIGDAATLNGYFESISDEPIDAVFHLAALAHVQQSFGSSAEVLRVNVIGTSNVVESVRKYFPESRFLSVSSSEVYGRVAPSDLPVNEEAPPAPISPYAASKAAAEQVALQAFRAYGQQIIVARPFNHIGPGQSDSYVVSALAKRLVIASREKSRIIAVGNLDARRDFTDVRDVVGFYRSAVLGASAGEIYNVCSGRSLRIVDVAHRLIELLGFDVELIVDPNLTRTVEVSEMKGDASKSKVEISWVPTIPIDESLQDVLRWWSDHL